MSRSLLVLLAALAMTGCASIVNDSTHPVKIETKTTTGSLVPGADCKLSNDYGSTDMKSGSTVPLRRSSKDMDITCTHPGHPEAKARAISRANAGLAGNIIFGGGIGAIIDHNKGTAYTYPTWLQLVFGQTLVFDRRDENEGAPVPGKTPAQAAQGSPAVADNQINPTSAACSQGMAPCTR